MSATERIGQTNRRTDASHTLIVGIGSPHGDDQAGWQVADRLAARISPDIAVRKAKSPADLFAWLDDAERLIVCDACRGLGRVGQICRWTWPTADVENMIWSGTHDLTLPAVLELADTLGRLPAEVVVWAVEATAGAPGAELSPDVAKALAVLFHQIVRELDHTPSEDTSCTSSP